MTPARQSITTQSLARVASVVLFAAGCGGAVQPDENAAALPTAFTATLAAGPATYVLSQVERQRGEDIVMFDHRCAEGRILLTFRDTIVLNADGAFRRSGLLSRTIGDRPSDNDPVIATGRWQPVARPSLLVPSIAIRSSTPNGRSIGTYEVQVTDAATLQMESGIGGSCPGSPNDGRSARFTYTRR